MLCATVVLSSSLDAAWDSVPQGHIFHDDRPVPGVKGQNLSGFDENLQIEVALCPAVLRVEWIHDSMMLEPELFNFFLGLFKVMFYFPNGKSTIWGIYRIYSEYF